MARLLKSCEICQKPLELEESFKVGSDIFNVFRCGHTFPLTAKGLPIPLDISFDAVVSEKSSFDFQKDGVRKAFESNFNLLIADPMGLGKTIQALVAAREGKFKSILIVVKSATIYQWVEEIREWFSPYLNSTFVIQGSKGFIPPGFKCYIISMDTISKFVKEKKSSLHYTTRSAAYFCSSARAEYEISDDLKSLDIDLLIVDECHSFKNPESKRSAALVAFVSGCDIKHKLFLSGTPIKNRADEYFVLLNLLDPENFSSLQRFRDYYLTQDPISGKYKRIAPHKLELFNDITKDYIIRREKNEVLSLPPFRRSFNYIQMIDEKLKVLYNKELAKLADVSVKSNLNFYDIQENLMALRRITGMAKVSYATEYVDVFLETTESEKIAIGVHHQSVRDNLYLNFVNRGFKPLKYSGEDSLDQKERVRRKFCEDPESRVLIVNMLAGGVGLNLQDCNNVLVLERQWNAADEEQFEGRFNRQGQKLPVLAEYMIAKETIDEYFSAMVEEKRRICGEALDGWDMTSDSGMIRELVEKTIAHKA